MISKKKFRLNLDIEFTGMEDITHILFCSIKERANLELFRLNHGPLFYILYLKFNFIFCKTSVVEKLRWK